MSPLLLSILLVGTSVGWFCVGYIVQLRQTHYWRVRWIEKEHDLARLQHREPQDIETV